MKIYLIRHGETTGDVEDRYGGAYDDHLTEKGRAQIEETALQVVGKGIEVIFSSPLIRAQETAEIINSRLNCEIKVVNDIQERNYGVLGGLTKEEAKEKYPEAVEAHKDPHNTDPEGEGLEEFNKRVISAFDAITQHGDKTIAIVAHGGPIKVILRHLGKEIPEKVDDGGIIDVEV